MSGIIKLSAKTHYAFLFLEFLAHRVREKRPISIAEFIEEKGMGTKKFLEHITRVLRVHGYIHSFKGFGGGYVLAKKVSAISLMELLNIFEGPTRVLPCHIKPCKLERTCQSKTIGDILSTAVFKSMRNIYLSDIIHYKNNA